MTIAEIMQEARLLSLSERQALIKFLVDSLVEAPTDAKTFQEIDETLRVSEEPILISSEITDPVEWAVEWVKAQQGRKFN